MKTTMLHGILEIAEVEPCKREGDTQRRRANMHMRLCQKLRQLRLGGHAVLGVKYTYWEKPTHIPDFLHNHACACTDSERKPARGVNRYFDLSFLVEGDPDRVAEVLGGNYWIEPERALLTVSMLERDGVDTTTQVEAQPCVWQEPVKPGRITEERGE